MPHSPRYISGTSLNHTHDDGAKSSIGEGTKSLLEAESAFMARWQGRGSTSNKRLQRTGVAFSGGGVRSAAFSLGVLQTLAAKRLLERFDYLSSVSGGGFVVGSLIWWLGGSEERQFSTSPEGFPFGVEKCPGVHQEAVADSSEASRNDDVKTTSKLSKADVLLNFLRQHGAYLTPGHGITPISAAAIVLRGVVLNLLVWIPVLIFLMLVLLWGSELFDSDLGMEKGAPSAFDALSWIGLGFSLLFILWCLGYSLSTSFRWNSHQERYLLHRWCETRVYLIVWPLLFTVVLSSIPWAADASLGVIGQFGGAAFVAIGLSIGLWSFLRPDSSWAVSFIRKRALPVGALCALYGVLLFAYQVANWLSEDAPGEAQLLFFLILCLAMFSGWFVNLNYIAVQRFYRDRLMEAFMPDPERALEHRGGAAAEADGQRLSDCIDPESYTGPYPLFNTHVPLASARDRRRRLRGGDSFVLSPLYCGSSSTGWLRTHSFMNADMTLPTAVAVSGSVNHQQSGLGGVGLAFNPLVSLLKVLLNLRMGYWVPNPGSPAQSRKPNHFIPGFGEALGIGRDEADQFLLLEDGGYFDNLGVYELLRRRLRLILACDAGADTGLADLHRVLQRAEMDFGTRVSFDNENSFVDVIAQQPARYPEEGKLAEKGHMVGHITYADGTAGTLVYLKSSLVAGMTFDDLGYGSQRAGFPRESTVDQFFDEEQFDAHRRLGNELAARLIRDVDIEGHMSAIR